jgi:cyclophilin family peptidyl-prolyl cis-trans isomerase
VNLRIPRWLIAASLVILLSLSVVSCRAPGGLESEATAARVSPGELGEMQAQMQWAQPPPMSIDPEKIYLATFKTEKGDIQVELFADRAPRTVNSFVFLVEQRFYDDTTFHRILPDFMAQGGDPTGTGAGGPGYQFEDEFSPDLQFDDAGYLAMANSGPNTNGSQFFMTYGPTPWLNGRHTIFGKVLQGMDVLRSLTPRDPTTNPDFEGDRLETVEIEVIEDSRLPAPTPTPIPIPPALEPGWPLGELAVEARQDLYTAPPEMIIDPDKEYRAEIRTSQGDMVVDLSAAEAPNLVNNFVVLASLGYWDGFPIVFVEPETFLLTGSPNGEPGSDVGYVLKEEGELPNVRGAVGYWYRSDQLAASGSQFYVLLADVGELDARHTVFGHVESGMDVAAQLSVEDRVISIRVLEDGEPFSE